MSTINDFVLTPKPKTVVAQDGQFDLANCGVITCVNNAAELLGIAKRLQAILRQSQRGQWTITAGENPNAKISLRLDEQAKIAAEGYELTISSENITVVGSTAAGVFYAAVTLGQILAQCDGTIPGCKIEDAPDFPVRGVMIDISRDKVPTIETLFRMIDELASWKINHVELYTEHTFAYRNHKRVWAQADPLTGEDVLQLDAYCQKRFVELTANQNSFGHFERWLNYPEYTDMANCPDGCELPNGYKFDGAFSIDPTNPKSLQLLDELYSELLPHFTSEKINVGCDETFDLGQGRTEALCKERGKYRVYLDFVLQVHKLISKHGRKMMFWGDIILEYPELIPELPKDMIALNWGYEAAHPFAKECPHFEKAGVPFYVCPGTSAWSTLIGRTENCLENLRNAAEQGLKHNAAGYLNTDWGDNGHWQYLPISYLGYIAGAALSWNHAGHANDDFVDAMNAHVFKDAAGVMGKVMHDLGNAYLKSGVLLGNTNVPFQLIAGWVSTDIPEGVTTQTVQATKDAVEATIAPLKKARMSRDDAKLICDEVRNNAAMAIYGCNRGIAMMEGKLQDTAVRQALQAELFQIVGKHQQLWTMRNRVGGLKESTAKMLKTCDN